MNKPNINAVIITHSADPDGLVSAAFVTDILESSGIAYGLRFADYPNLTEVMKNAAKETGKAIYILDLALRTKSVHDEVLKPLLDNNEVHYFDHHEIEVDRIGLLEKGLNTFISTSERICTARLIAEHYQIEGSEHKLLSDCAQATDYPGTVDAESTQLGTELAQAISNASRLGLDNVVQIIREGLYNHRVWRDGYSLTGELSRGAARTRKAMEIATAQLEKSATSQELFNGTDSAVVVAVAMADQSLYMMAGYQVLNQRCPEAQVCFVSYESVSVFAGPGMSSKQPQVPLLAFLEEQGGGGRNDMGGFQYKSPTHIGNYEERRDTLLQKYEEFLKQYWMG